MSKQGRVYRVGDGWGFDVDVGPGAVRNRKRKRGYSTKHEAVSAMEAERSRYSSIRNPTTLTVGDYLTGWVEDRYANGRIRASTTRGYRGMMDRAGEWFAGVRLDRLTAADLDRYYRHLLTTGGRDGRGRSARTVHQIHAVIKTALRDAVRKGLIGRNEAEMADPPKPSETPTSEMPIWTTEEAQAFLEAPWLPADRRILWATAFGTGLRRGELAGLYWRDIEENRITVRRSRTLGPMGRPYEAPPKSKNGYRTVPIHEALADRLRSWWALQAQVFTEAGLGPQYVFTNSTLGPWDPNGMTRKWQRDTRRAVSEGLVSRYMRLHDARHWYGTQLFAVGTDLPTIRDQMGHASAAFTASIYGHSDETRAKAAGEAVGALLWG
ncbi:MAG: site-specific integrase [Actinobacteria bacterium]|jgi:integrase|nr:site-specific integrase [Actinomycetota bacterium]